MSTDIPEDPVELTRAAEEAIRQIAEIAGDDVTPRDVHDELRVLFEGEDTRDHPLELAGDTPRDRLFSDTGGVRHD